MTDQATIRAHVDKHAARFADLLKEACGIPSISAEGRALGEMAGWLVERFEKLGAEVGRLEVPGAPPAVLATFRGAGERTLMIYDHYDVQPVDPLDLWETDPFAADEREGRIFARGAADNKGDLVARLCAIETAREVAGDLPFTVTFLVEGEEESGSPHFDDLCRAHAGRLSADDCVWEGAWFEHDGRPPVVYGCKGLLYVELRARMLSGDQHSSLAVYAPSAAWELVRAIASMRDAEGRIAIEGFRDDIVPPDEEELALVAAITFGEGAERRRIGADAFVGGLSGETLKREMLYAPTANIAGFATGYAVPGATKTVLPAEALAKMDFRLVPDQDAADIADKIRRHLDTHGFGAVELTVISRENPSRSPRGTVLGRAVEQTADTWFPKPPSIWPMMVATGPMSPIERRLGIPICSPPGVIRPDSMIHAPNENVRIGDFLDIVGFTVAYLEAYAGA